MYTMSYSVLLWMSVFDIVCFIIFIIYCDERKCFLSFRYEVMKEVITDSGSSQMRLQLMNGSAPLPHNPALSPREAVVMEVSLNTSSEQIKVVVSKCWATPTRDPEETYRQTFLESRSTANYLLHYNFCLIKFKYIPASTVNVYYE